MDSAPQPLPGCWSPSALPASGLPPPLPGRLSWGSLRALSLQPLSSCPAQRPRLWSSQNNLGHSPALTPPEGVAPPPRPVPEKEQQVPECGPALQAFFPCRSPPHLLRPWPPRSSRSALLPLPQGLCTLWFPPPLPFIYLVTRQFPRKALLTKHRWGRVARVSLLSVHLKFRALLVNHPCDGGHL